MKTIYLDNNATSQVVPEVLEAILPYVHELYGNPSSMFFSVARWHGKLASRVSRWRHCSVQHLNKSFLPVVVRKAATRPFGRTWLPIQTDITS
ncbi:MAG: aminotransferase class V-fold PLP-dependent enzyme [Desulfatiglandales bacterium]|nr:aminotransferase class V-fold PLP-dependent enzyme [Desulfatiglandales bacterium]